MHEAVSERVSHKGPARPRRDEQHLDERRAVVLRAVVEEYIESAEPVGSQRVARTRQLGVSSATVRNDMAALEREGFLTQPHTSAGRIPTDRGYRYFVDRLARVETLRAPYAARVSDFFTRAQSALEDMLHETSRLLAGITDQAALVVGPQIAAASVMSVQLVPLRPDVVLAVAVLSNGAVEKVTLHLDRDQDEEVVHRAGEAVAEAATGRPLDEMGDPKRTGSRGVDELSAETLSRLGDLAGVDAGEPVFVGGASNIAAEAGDFSAAETVSRLLGLLEQQFLVVTLARNLLEQGVSVRIGSENERVELKECSVILAPVTVGDDLAGSVGVLGPTRMDYARAMAAVTTVSNSLARHLSS